LGAAALVGALRVDTKGGHKGRPYDCGSRIPPSCAPGVGSAYDVASYRIAPKP